MDVVNFAGAAWSLPGDFHSLENVINVVDPIPMLFGKGFEFWDKNNRYEFHLHDAIHPLAGYLAEWEYRNSHDAWLQTPAGKQVAARQAAEIEAARRAQMLRNWDKR